MKRHFPKFHPTQFYHFLSYHIRPEHSHDDDIRITEKGSVFQSITPVTITESALVEVDRSSKV